MKSHIMGIALIVFGLAGCASPAHYYRQADGATTLYLRKPEAKEVRLAVSSDGFRPKPAAKVGGGTWAATVPGHGEFTYFYLVDGNVYLPPCANREEDDFGGANCVFAPRR